jgi:hypothetical protein
MFLYLSEYLTDIAKVLKRIISSYDDLVCLCFNLIRELIEIASKMIRTPAN